MKDKLLTGALIVISTLTTVKAFRAVRQYKLEKDLYIEEKSEDKE